MRITSDLRFAIIPEWLIDHPDLTPVALRVFAVMARYADKDTDEACRSRATIARRAGCSAATLDRALRVLRGIGAVEWERQQDDRGVMPSRFTLHFMTPPLITGDDNPLRVDDEPSSIDPEREKKTGNGCQREGCDRGPNHPGPHRDPWWDAIEQAIYPGEQIPWHQETLAGRLACRARKAGHPPERILEAAAWIADTWGPAKLTLACLVEHYERASGELAKNGDQVRSRLRQLAKPKSKPPAHEHDWQPHFKDPSLEVCAVRGCGERRSTA